MNVLSGLNKQIREEVRARLDDAALRMDLVPREEFERLEAMLREARREQEKQDRRIAALEKALLEKTAGSAKKKAAGTAKSRKRK